MKTSKRTLTQVKILRGMDRVYEKLIEQKRKANSDLVILQDGKIVKIKPQDSPTYDNWFQLIIS